MSQRNWILGFMDWWMNGLMDRTSAHEHPTSNAQHPVNASTEGQ
jgi:hypothetical protein